MSDYLDFFSDEELKGKVFNTTGPCNKDIHYMVNIDSKLKEIIKLVQRDKYFVINRPRQYGKTTTLNLLEKILSTRYEVVKLSFEGIGDVFKSEEDFCLYFTKCISQSINVEYHSIVKFVSLAEFIIKITENKDIILIIDEVDKASNNKILLDFLGMLRSLYLSKINNNASTFKSVILAGVYDIKNLKLKIRDNEEVRYNSPWNIAVNFDVNMNFDEQEISTMITDYSTENNLKLNIEMLSRELYKFTSGYPFLVSRICQIIDEVLDGRHNKWEEHHIQKAIKILLSESNTLFDDLIKNLENNKELYDYMYNLLVLNIPCIFNIDNPIVNLGVMFGYLSKDENNNTTVANQIIKERIYNYMISKNNNSTMADYNFKDNFITDDNGLNMEKVLLKFQQFMKENYSSRDIGFLEKHGVLLFLAFVKPIINGVGFDYKEVQISEERRLDMVIQYNSHKYIIETKIWHGDIAHSKGLNQLKNYLDIEGMEKGYLLIFNFNKNKEFTNKKYKINDKEIFEVTV